MFVISLWINRVSLLFLLMYQEFLQCSSTVWKHWAEKLLWVQLLRKRDSKDALHFWLSPYQENSQVSAAHWEAGEPLNSCRYTCLCSPCSAQISIRLHLWHTKTWCVYIWCEDSIRLVLLWEQSVTTNLTFGTQQNVINYDLLALLWNNNKKKITLSM